MRVGNPSIQVRKGSRRAPFLAHIGHSELVVETIVVEFDWAENTQHFSGLLTFFSIHDDESLSVFN